MIQWTDLEIIFGFVQNKLFQIDVDGIGNGWCYGAADGEIHYAISFLFIRAMSESIMSFTKALKSTWEEKF